MPVDRSARRALLVSVLLLLPALALLSGVRASEARRAPLPPAATPFPGTLPDGEGRAVAERACVICHSPMLITQQAKDSTGWAKTLTQMQKWNAPLDSSERDTLQRWFTAKLGPRRR